MSEGIVGALRVAIGMDSAAFERGVQKSVKGLEKVGKAGDSLYAQMKQGFAGVNAQMANLSGVVAAGFGAIVGGSILAAGKQVLDFADDLATAADQTGIAVERFQTLKQAFRALEISGDTFDKVMRNLVATMGDVQSGADNAATKALDRMGVKARILSGEIQTTDQLLDAIADSAKRFGTEAEFASAVTDIFGKRAGPQLAAALRNGSAAIKNMEADLISAGTVLTEQQINKLAEANEVIDRWQENASYRLAIFAADAITAFEKAGDAYDQWRARQRVAEDKAAKDDNWFFKGLRAYGGSRRQATSRSGPVVMTNPASGSDVNRRLGFNVTNPVVPKQAPKPVQLSSRGGGGGGGGGSRRRGSGGGGARAAKEVDQFSQAMEAMQRRVADARLEFDLMDMSLDEISTADARLHLEALRVEQERGAKWTELQREQYRAAAKDLRLLTVEALRMQELQADIVAFDPKEFMPESMFGDLGKMLIDLPNLAKTDFGLPMMQTFSDVAASIANSMSAMQNSIGGFVDSIKRGDIVGIIGNLANLIGGVVGTINGFKTGFTGAPGRAAGGPITAGRPYLVGERGPELIVPNTSGSVIPNGKLRGTTGQVVQKFDLRGAVMTADLLAQMNRIGEQAAVRGAAMGSTGAIKSIARMRGRNLY